MTRSEPHHGPMLHFFKSSPEEANIPNIPNSPKGGGGGGEGGGYESGALHGALISLLAVRRWRHRMCYCLVLRSPDPGMCMSKNLDFFSKNSPEEANIPNIPNIPNMASRGRP